MWNKRERGVRRLTGLSCKGHVKRVRRGEAGNAKPLKRAEGLRGGGIYMWYLFERFAREV